ncbi:unnamed protein product [Closterium sp. NIES-53]
MASLRVLAFDHEGRPVQFDTWLYLLSDSKDSVSLFDLASGAATAPPATADSSTRSQWFNRDAAARLAIRNHLPLAECAHFGQHRTAQTLYNAVVARYSSPATAALGRLLLPYLFPELFAFATLEDLVSHLCASDARYCAAVRAEFLHRNPPPMYITLNFIVTRLPDSLRSVRDHFLSLDPTSLTIDLLEQHLLTGETSASAVGAARGTLCPPFFEGCSPSPLTPSYASAAAADVSVPEDVGAASTSARRRSSKGKGGRGGGGGSGSGGGGRRGGGSGGVIVGGSGGSGGGGGGSGGSGSSGGGGTCSGGIGTRRVDLLKSRIVIFDLDLDAILSAMYDLSDSTEGDCYRYVPPDPGIASAALGASESGTLPGTAPAEALHTFTLDSSASRFFFHDSTTLTPLPAPVPVRLGDPSGGPVVARSSIVLPCPAVLSGSLSGLHLPSFSTNLVSTAALQDALLTTTTPGGQRVWICTCTRTGRHLATFTRRPESSLYTLAIEPSHVAASAQVSASVLPPHLAPCSVLLGRHLRRVVPYYRLFPYRTAPLPPPPLFLAPGPPPVDPLPPQGPAPSGVSQVDAVEPVEVAVDSGATTGAEPAGAGSGGAVPGGAESAGAEPGGAASEGAEPGGTESGGAEPGGAEPGGAEPGGAEPGGAGSARVASRGTSSRRELLSPQELREWFARRWSRAAGGGGTPIAASPGGAHPGGAGAAGPSGAAEAAGVGPTGGSAGASGGPGVTGSPGTGAAGATAAGGAGSVGAGVSPGAGPSEGAGVGAVGAGGAAGAGAAAGRTGAIPAGSGGATRLRPYFVPLLEQVLGLPPSSGLAERRAPASRPASPVRTARTSCRAARPRPPAVPGTHQMALCPSTAPLRVPLPSPPESSLPVLADPESDSLRAASPTVARLLSTVVTDPSLASTAVSALVAELVAFAARCRLDYAASLVAESGSVCPPSVGGECALSTDVLEDKQEEFQCFAAALPHLVSTLIAPEGDPDALDIPTPRSYAEAIEGPYSSQWQSAMDAGMASWKSTGTYVDEVPPPGANIVSGMWIFRVKWPPGSPPIFKARYVARGFSQRQGVDYFQTISSTVKMTTLRVLLHVAAQRDYELHSLDFSTAFLQGSLHEEIWLRRPPGFTGSFPPGTQWSLRRPVYGLRQAPREWHDTLRTTLAALGFAPSTADPSLFLRTDTSLPQFYILVYLDDLVFATADTAGLAHMKSELQKRHTCTDPGELRSYLGLQITGTEHSAPLP